MSLLSWTTIVTCVAQLMLAGIAFGYSERRSLGVILGFLCLVLCGWSFSALAYDLSGHGWWRTVDVSISPLTAPLALHFTLGFAGARHRLGSVLRGLYCAFICLSAASLSALVVPAMEGFSGSSSWALLHLALVLPTLTLALDVLVRHLRAHTLPDERTRTRLVLTALVLGTVFGSTELLGDLGLEVPRLGHLASLFSTVLLAIVALRFSLIARQPSRAGVVYASAIGFLALLAFAGLYSAVGQSPALLTFGTVLVVGTLLAVGARLATSIATEHAQRERHAFLGRMADQMAHDLQNPIAAIKGAAQFLAEERAQGRSMDDHFEFVELIHGESERLARLVHRYRSLDSPTSQGALVDLNAVVGQVLEASEVSAPNDVTVLRELDEHIPPCVGDGDMIATALDNLVRNGFEAMPAGGTLRIHTRATKEAILVSVGDSGGGLDPREKERVFDERFTTKAEGSGLGLPFVKRVVEAHRGHVRIESKQGHGTLVELTLPIGGTP